MNDSGLSILALSKYYNIEPEEILVIHDELDIEPGNIKLKLGGGHGGHNGLKSIISSLQSNNFWRLRIGIGHPKQKKRVNNHVLEDFKEDEEEKINEISENIVKQLPTLIGKKIDLFSSKVNQDLNGI